MLGYLTGQNEGGPVRMTSVNHTNRSDAALAPGVFRRNNYWEVVNFDPRESETDRCTVDDFSKRFGITITADEVQEPLSTASTGLTRLQFRQNEFWHWLIVALVALAALEFFIANRATA
jgi:hypothetical protein